MNPHTAGLHHDRANGCIGIRPNEWLLAAVAHSNAAALVAATARPWPPLSIMVHRSKAAIDTRAACVPASVVFRMLPKR